MDMNQKEFARETLKEIIRGGGIDSHQRVESEGSEICTTVTMAAGRLEFDLEFGADNKTIVTLFDTEEFLYRDCPVAEKSFEIGGCAEVAAECRSFLAGYLLSGVSA